MSIEVSIIKLKYHSIVAYFRFFIMQDIEDIGFLYSREYEKPRFEFFEKICNKIFNYFTQPYFPANFPA